jgi:hypothetical protein
MRVFRIEEEGKEVAADVLGVSITAVSMNVCGR